MGKKRAADFIVAEILRLTAAGVLLFWCAGRIDWWAGWAALGMIVAAEAAVVFIGIRRYPALLRERLGVRGGDQAWDIAIYFSIRFASAACFVLAGLDQRHGWTGDFSVRIQIAGFVTCLLGYTLFVWATASNQFFSIMVRVQSDRGHTVATGGPYRFVRHPGYAGMVMVEVAVPVLLGSWWALIPGAAGAVLILVRTVIEDRTLQAKLAGYADFTQRVRYRLMPGVW